MAKKILIAEDEQPLAEALKLKLDGSGYEATIVYDGEEALSNLKKKKFDLLLLDLIMPKKDGFAVLKTLKKRGSKIPVVVVSNLGQEDDMERCKAFGVKDYLVKSDTPLNQIVAKIETYLK